jgi:hypothetical protein
VRGCARLSAYARGSYKFDYSLGARPPKTRGGNELAHPADDSARILDSAGGTEPGLYELKPVF